MKVGNMQKIEERDLFGEKENTNNPRILYYWPVNWSTYHFGFSDWPEGAFETIPYDQIDEFIKMCWDNGDISEARMFGGLKLP